MSQYLLSVHGSDESVAAVDPSTMQAMFEAVGAFNEEVRQSGAWVYANGLMSASTATVVDATKGETVFTDGPYLETKEHIGGFWIIDVADLDAALAWAAKGSAACQGPVEVRPFQPTDGA
jgi:hypothetical protein